MKNNRVVAYMRSCSPENGHESIELQRLAILSFCQMNGLILEEEYIDECKSGITDQRPAFQCLMNDARRNPDWGTVIIHDISRFSRKAEDLYRYSKLLDDNGIELISLITAHHELLESVLKDFAI